MAIENVFPPIPSEIVLAFGGFLTNSTDLTKLGVTIASTIGAIIGAIILYFIGYLVSFERLEKFTNTKFGKILRLKAEDIKKTRSWFEKHGNKAVFLCRFVPIVRSLISIPAGTSKMDFKVFLFLTIVGTFIWNTVLILLGSFAGEAWESILTYFDTYSQITLIVILIIIAIVAFLFYKNRLKKKK